MATRQQCHKGVGGRVSVLPDENSKGIAFPSSLERTQIFSTVAMQRGCVFFRVLSIQWGHSRCSSSLLSPDLYTTSPFYRKLRTISTEKINKSSTYQCLSVVCRSNRTPCASQVSHCHNDTLPNIKT